MVFLLKFSVQLNFLGVIGTKNKKPVSSWIRVFLLKKLKNYFLYFLLNLSIRPAVSTSFCLPVKKGWQAEQISTVIFFAVDRVSITFPQAQVIVVSSYLGCMPSFMLVSFARIIHCQNRQVACSLT